MERMLLDLKIAMRVLVRRPLFSVVAIITLAIGIGANTAIFSTVNAVVLKPLPYAQQDRLVAIWERHAGNNQLQQPASYPNVMSWREQSGAFEEIAAYRNISYTLLDGGEPARVNTARVTTNLPALLRLQPALGRFFNGNENEPTAMQVAIIGHGLWQRRYGGSLDVIGKGITLDGAAYTIIGILPSGLKFPTSDTDLWIPVIPQPRELVRGFRFLRVIGRLRPDITIEQAREEMAMISERLQHADAQYSSGWDVELVPLQEQVVGRVKPALIILLAAVGLILLIACANVANLLLVRFADGKMELAIRKALGAGYLTLIRQTLTESLLLSLLGSAVGLLLAHWGVSAITLWAENIIPRADEIVIDRPVLLFTLSLSLLTGLLFGVMPAAKAAATPTLELLKSGSGTVSRSDKRFLSALVVTEIALSTLLLVGTLLLLRSFIAVTAAPLGFDPHNLLTISMNLPAVRYKEQSKQVEFYEQAAREIAALPGITSVAVASRVPVTGMATATFTIKGRPVAAGDEPVADYRAVTPNYFSSLSVPLVQGRHFTAQDNDKTADVVIINEVLAERFWPGANPVGESVRLADEKTRWRTIVGVVGNVRHAAMDGEIGPAVYVPLPQNSWANALRSAYLIIRTASAPHASLPIIAKTIHGIDSELALAQTRTMEEIVTESLAPRRFNLLAMSLFAAIAMLLAGVGIYGVMAYNVSQRRREFGIRMALGADKREITFHVLKYALTISLIGVAIGCAGALALTRLMEKVLFGVTAGDPLAIIAAPLPLLALALLASLLPALRAATTDPAIALRAD